MPHSTPARDLIRTSRDALRERPGLESCLRTARSTTKQKRYAEHMQKVWKERVGEALRAYVNDIFVDDDMHRRDVLGVPEVRSAVITTGLTVERHGVPEADILRDTATLVTAFVKEEATEKNKRWFDKKQLHVVGLSLREGLPGFYEFGSSITRYVSSGAKIPNTYAPMLSSVVSLAHKGCYPFAHGDCRPWGTVNFSTNVATPNAVNGECLQDVATRVLEHTDRQHYPQHDNCGTLRLIGYPGSDFLPSRVLLDQELDTEGFLRAVFHRDSPLIILPTDTKREIFFWVVLRRAERKREWAKAAWQSANARATAGTGSSLTSANQRFQQIISGEKKYTDI